MHARLPSGGVLASGAPEAAPCAAAVARFLVVPTIETFWGRPAGREIFKEKSKSEVVMLAPIPKAESSRCAGCTAGMSTQFSLEVMLAGTKGSLLSLCLS